MMNFTGSAGDMLQAMKAAGVEVPEEVEEAAKRAAAAPPSVQAVSALSCSDPCCTHDHSHGHDHQHDAHHTDSTGPEWLAEARFGDPEGVPCGVIEDGVKSFQEMETAVLQRNVKGVILPRLPHTLTEETQRWVAGWKDVYRTCASKETLTVVQQQQQQQQQQKGGCCEEGGGCCDDIPLSLSHHGNNDDNEDECTDVTAAAKRLVRKLPVSSVTETIESDAAALAAMMLRLCPGQRRRVTMQVNVLGRNACSRWHQDNVMARALVTYNGPGTWAVPDAAVAYDQFEATVRQGSDVSDPAIVPHASDIHRPGPNTVVFMKGGKWPGIEGVRGYKGLTHKSPTMPTDARGNPKLFRLMLKVDIDGA